MIFSRFDQSANDRVSWEVYNIVQLYRVSNCLCSLMKKIAFLCYQLEFWLGNFVTCGPVQVITLWKQLCCKTCNLLQVVPAAGIWKIYPKWQNRDIVLHSTLLHFWNWKVTLSNFYFFFLQWVWILVGKSCGRKWYRNVPGKVCHYSNPRQIMAIQRQLTEKTANIGRKWIFKRLDCAKNMKEV